MIDTAIPAEGGAAPTRHRDHVELEARLRQAVRLGGERTRVLREVLTDLDRLHERQMIGIAIDELQRVHSEVFRAHELLAELRVLQRDGDSDSWSGRQALEEVAGVIARILR